MEVHCLAIAEVDMGLAVMVVLKFSCYFSFFDEDGLVMNENRLFCHCAGMLWSWNG